MPPSLSSNGFWSRDPHNISHNQLHKFWVELSPLARRELLRVEKQALFEQARKNMYCSRCNGLLLEGFMQILMYGKSLHQEGLVGHIPCDRPGPRESLSEDVSSMRNGCQDETQDPSVHPWGGLITTRDGALTLLDCYIYSKSLKGLQNVFNSAHARERERELLYPDACGGGGRGWISQGMTSYSRGHGTRESCALHTARLSCDTLVDFWSALGEETRQSLLKMKEEDFIERLMYRFDSKRFCRDCRKNVIREFKELKELKRIRRETHCTSWFCATDTAFQYEVSEDMVQADWCQTFADTIGTYDHFEWAVGTAEGKSDILEFENVGMKGSAQAKGLELGDLGSCYITLKAWKLDGHSTELSVKAHALKDQQCVHSRLVVGDGIVAITRAESIRRFFEHAEEAEEDEDDDALDKDGNELDGECSRPQKHAKSPELAREFLLDAATVIFMEQVEKAFREGTARQNAHSIFVCLALKLLEERVHIACKEIITLEKQMKLLEEEEKEKVEEEERKERRRTKEREKKLRRKERLKGKGKDRENNCLGSSEDPVISDITREELSPQISDKMISSRDSFSGTVDIMVSRPQSPVVQEDRFSNGHVDLETKNSSCDNPDGESSIVKDENGLFMVEQSKFSHCRSNNRRESVLDPSLKRLDRRRFAVCSENGTLVNNPQPRLHVEKLEKGLNGLVRHLRANAVECSARNAGLKFGEKFQYSNNRMSERCNLRSCSCNQHSDYRAKVEPHVPLRWENRSVSKFESVLDVSKQFYRGNKFNRSYYTRESCGRSKNKTNTLNNTSSRDSLHTKKVWEPMESKKYNPRSNSDSDIVTLRSSEFKVDGLEPIGCCSKVGRNSGEIDHEDNNLKESRILSQGLDEGAPSGFEEEVKRACYSPEVADVKFALHPIGNSSLSVTSDRNMSSTSNSDNCSSCLSEGDSNTASSNSPNMESLSTSDSEDASQQSEGRETPACIENNENPPTKSDHCSDTTNLDVNMGAQRQGMLPLMHNQNVQVPVYEAPSPLRGLYHQNPASWPAAPNGLMPFPHPNHYLLASPFGYGLNESSHFCMQYGALQRFPTTPLFDPSCQSPVYHPDSNADRIITKEHVKVSRPGKAQAASNGADVDKAVPKALCPTERLPNGEAEQKENSAKVHMGNNGFSLFHFGGPVAVSTGHKSDCVPSKEEGVGDFPPNVSPNHVDGDGACNKKETTIEEYDLFAASNGIRFSFF